MELSVGRKSEGRRNRQYTVIKKLYTLLEGDKCSGRNLNRVRRCEVPARRVVMVGLPEKVLFAQTLEGKRESEPCRYLEGKHSGKKEHKVQRPYCNCVKGIVRSPVWPGRRNVIEDKIREVSGPDPIRFLL